MNAARLLLLMLVLAATGARAQHGPAHGELLERAKAIKPTPQELKWQQIPWLMDLATAQRLAQREQRPILLWATGDDPFERC